MPYLLPSFFGIFASRWYLIVNWCHLTSCVDVFWNQSYVDLICPQSCVDLDFDISWTTISYHTLVCPLGLLCVFVQIVSHLVLESLCMHTHYYIYYTACFCLSRSNI